VHEQLFIYQRIQHYIRRRVNKKAKEVDQTKGHHKAININKAEAVKQVRWSLGGWSDMDCSNVQ
jgi:hypothetical protein